MTFPVLIHETQSNKWLAHFPSTTVTPLLFCFVLQEEIIRKHNSMQYKKICWCRKTTAKAFTHIKPTTSAVENWVKSNLIDRLSTQWYTSNYELFNGQQVCLFLSILSHFFMGPNWQSFPLDNGRNRIYRISSCSHFKHFSHRSSAIKKGTAKKSKHFVVEHGCCGYFGRCYKHAFISHCWLCYFPASFWWSYLLSRLAECLLYARFNNVYPIPFDPYRLGEEPGNTELLWT